jgi:hypothetical protein
MVKVELAESHAQLLDIYIALALETDLHGLSGAGTELERISNMVRTGS